MEGALRPALAAIAAGQYGLFRRQQAIVGGYSPEEIRARLGRRGDWLALRRGVYLPQQQWERGGDTERAWWVDVAAHLEMTLPHLLSHDSAARGLGIPIVAARSQLTHVTRAGVGGSRTRHGVKHHLGREHPADVALREGIPMTGPARTALDLAREHGFATGVVAVDAVLHRGTGHRAFEQELARMTSWPHVRTCRAAFEFADGRAESPGESLTRILLGELGWGPLDLQFPIPVRGGVRWCDLRIGRHIVEFDGKVKYVPRALGGVAELDAWEVAWNDRIRDTDVSSLGLGISHVTWGDLFAGREATKVRLLKEEAATRLRFGRELPEELSRFAASHPRRTAPAA